MSKPKIAVIIGSIRPTRQADKPAKWLAEQAKAYGAFEVELVDLKDYPIAAVRCASYRLMDADPQRDCRQMAGQSLSEFDGFIIVTPEYNHSIPGALKNAIDWAYKPFIKKAVACMSYGSVGGARAVEHLRTIMVELQAVNVRHGLHIGGSEFGPILMGKKTWDDVLPHQAPFTKDVFDNLLWWANATKAARALGD